MIYGYYGHAFEAWHLVVMAIVSFIFGHAARCRSLLAGRVGLPIGFAIAGLLICDGIIHSQHQPQAFINNEFTRLLFLVWITTNLSSAIVGWLEPMVEKHREHVEEMRRKREQDRLEEQRQIEATVWERTRPEREARERAQREVAREQELQRKAREAQAAQEKAVADAAARVQAELDANRRDQARRSVQLAYFAASPKVQQAITWDWLKEYIDQYLSDKCSVDIVEENAKKMVRTIQGHINPNGKKKTKPKSIEEVVQEFDQKEVVIRGLQVPEHERASMLADLAMQRAYSLEQRA